MLADSSVNPEEIERFSRIAEEWWNPLGKFKPLHRINPVRLAFIRDQAAAHFGRSTAGGKPFTDLSLIDIGCGGGLICEPMARLGFNVTGIDATPRNIDVASLHARESGLDINYRFATAEQMVAENHRYDVVTALEVVEHVVDPQAFVASCAKLLKPDGLMFMSTLNRTLKSYALAIVGAEYVLRWLPRGTHDWKKFLRPSELAACLRASNLEIAQMRGLVFQPFKNEWSLSERDLEVNYLLSAKLK